MWNFLGSAYPFQHADIVELLISGFKHLRKRITVLPDKQRIPDLYLLFFETHPNHPRSNILIRKSDERVALPHH